MVRIELRDDGWFEAGKNPNPQIPIANVIYPHKQELKKHLQSINAPTINDLEKALLRIPKIKFFEGAPYLNGDKVCISKDEGMGEVYLGQVI